MTRRLFLKLLAALSVVPAVKETPSTVPTTTAMAAPKPLFIDPSDRGIADVPEFESVRQRYLFVMKALKERFPGRA